MQFWRQFSWKRISKAMRPKEIPASDVWDSGDLIRGGPEDRGAAKTRQDRSSSGRAVDSAPGDVTPRELFCARHAAYPSFQRNPADGKRPMAVYRAGNGF